MRRGSSVFKLITTAWSFAGPMARTSISSIIPWKCKKMAATSISFFHSREIDSRRPEISFHKCCWRHGFFPPLFLIRFYLVYEGTSHSYRVPKLKESTSYTFRICARNEVGEGPYSEEVVYTTTRAPPPTLKSKNRWRINYWFHGGFICFYLMFDIRAGSAWLDGNELPYRLVSVPITRVKWQRDLSGGSDTDQRVAGARSGTNFLSTYFLNIFKRILFTWEIENTWTDQLRLMLQVRRCSESEMAVDCLDSRTEYSVRVCPIRLCQDGEIPGAYSPSKTFLTPSSQLQHQSTINSQQNASSSQVK